MYNLIKKKSLKLLKNIFGTVGECNETDIQLVKGAIPAHGEVKICLNGFWGSVCAEGWDYRDTTVVCKQLGVKTAFC